MDFIIPKPPQQLQNPAEPLCAFTERWNYQRKNASAPAAVVCIRITVLILNFVIFALVAISVVLFFRMYSVEAVNCLEQKSLLFTLDLIKEKLADAYKTADEALMAENYGYVSGKQKQPFNVVW